MPAFGRPISGFNCNRESGGAELIMPRIDINSDLAEGFGPYRCGDDEAMLSIVTSANVACGFHAGDPEIMARTFKIAREGGVAVGAHPGFPDLWGDRKS